MIEPIIISHIDKDVAPNGTDYSGRKTINPVRDVLNGRYLSSEEGETFQVENIKGTLEKTFSVSNGVNRCIGVFPNVEKNIVLFFYWNSQLLHKVFKYDLSADSFSTLITDNQNSPVLNFSSNPRYNITGVAMIGDILVWCDNNNETRYINITRSYTLNQQQISLIKIGPRNPPTFTSRATDATVVYNKLTADSFQFAFQYVYKDNEESVLSPYSRLCTADVFPAIESTARAKVLVTHTVDSDISGLLKEVRLLYRKNNEPNWYVWKTLTTFGSTIQEYFFNNEQGETVPTSTVEKLFDTVPNKSKALTIFRGRIFLNINEEGHSFTPPTLSLVRSPVNLGDILIENVQNVRGKLKKNGTYQAGIFFRGPMGRLTGITSKASINGRKWLITNDFNLNVEKTSGFPINLLQDSENIAVDSINVTLSGTGLPSGQYFIAISDEQSYAQYMQIPCHILWYILSVTNNPGVPNTVPILDADGVTDRVYRVDPPDAVAVYSYVHLLIPKECPFTPDTECFVRFCGQSVAKVEKVRETIGGFLLVCGIFGQTNWRSLGLSQKGVPLIEIFKLKSIVDPFFYQVAGPFNVNSSGVLQTTTINIEADTYYIPLREWNFLDVKLKSFSSINGEKRRVQINPGIYIESQSPTTKKSELATQEPVNPTPVKFSEFVDLTNVRKSDSSNIDLEKIAWSKGWPLVETLPEIIQRPSTLKFSDVYIEGSNVNGLNSFPAENIYDKVGQDRSPITKLVPTGNIMLAIHERHVTSIYVGEGIVRTGDTGFITKVENVIGDDRKLIGEFGSYHPESVQEIDGQVFAWDVFRGAVWRYTVEGIYPISSFGMKNYFKQRGEQYFASRDTLLFPSGIDKYHNEYLITMPHLFVNKQTETLQSYGGATGSHDIILTSGQYTVGSLYRVKIVPYKQSGTSANDQIRFNLTFGGVTPIKSNVDYMVTTAVEADATPIYIEFTYNGEGFIRVATSLISVPISVRISVEEVTVQGETWVFNYERKVWTHRYSFVPDVMTGIGNRLYSWKDDKMYLHNSTATRNNYYGVQYQRKIVAACNPQPNKVKTWGAVQIAGESIAADPTGTLKVVEVSNDQGQASYTRAKEFEKKEGIFYAPILKDVNTNGSLLSGSQIALRDGKDMRSKSLEVTINNDSTGRALLQKVNIVAEMSEFSI